MSNVMTGSPLKMDTATSTWAGNNLPNGLSLDVRKIYWENPTAAGNTVQITNSDGLVLWEATAEAAADNPSANQTFYFQPRELLLTKAQGWILKQISSGILWIYFVSE